MSCWRSSSSPRHASPPTPSSPTSRPFQADPFDASPLATAQVRYAEIESAMNEFSAIAPEEWAKQFRQERLHHRPLAVPFPTRQRPSRSRVRRRRPVRPRGLRSALRPEPRPPAGDHGLDRRARHGSGGADPQGRLRAHADRPRGRARRRPRRLAAHPLGHPPGQDRCPPRQRGRHRSTAGTGRGTA